MASEWSQRGYESKEIAARYIEYRPKTPLELVETTIEFLKEQYSGELDLCLDAGCGSGQTTFLLSPYFKKVIATDISVAQIEVAQSQAYPSNLEFRVSAAEQSPVEDNSVQLVNSSVAAHWFDVPAFIKDIDRVLCSKGVAALSTHTRKVLFTHPTKSEELLKALILFAYDRLDTYWASGLKHVDNDYADFHFPSSYEISKKEIWVKEATTLDKLVKNFSSWCGYNNYCKANGEAAGRELLNEFISNVKIALETTSNPEDIELAIRRRYFLLLARKP